MNDKNLNDYEIIPLKKCPNYYNELLHSIEKAFHYHPPHRFIVDFYPLMGGHNHHHNHLLINHLTKELVGHIGVLTKELQGSQSTLPVAMLGGIFIKEKYQKQGLFSYLMQSVLKLYQDQVALFFLWSDLIDVYQKFGFFLGGGLQEISITTINTTPRQSTLYRNLKSEEKKQLQNLYHHHAQQLTTFNRTQDDWEHLNYITSSNLYIQKRDGSEKISAYCMQNKGQDLQNIIHEFSYLPNCEAQFLEHLPPGKLWLPENHPLSSHFSSIQLKYMSLIRLANPLKLIPFIESILQNKIKMISWDSEKIHFTFQDENYLQTYPELLQNLWGPNRVKEWQTYVPPLFISGLDSI